MVVTAEGVQGFVVTQISEFFPLVFSCIILQPHLFHLVLHHTTGQVVLGQVVEIQLFCDASTFAAFTRHNEGLHRGCRRPVLILNRNELSGIAQLDGVALGTVYSLVGNLPVGFPVHKAQLDGQGQGGARFLQLVQLCQNKVSHIIALPRFGDVDVDPPKAAVSHGEFRPAGVAAAVALRRFFICVGHLIAVIGGGDTVDRSRGRGYFIEGLIRFVVAAVLNRFFFIALYHGFLDNVDVFCGFNCIIGSRAGFSLLRNPHHLIPDAVFAEGNGVIKSGFIIRLTGLPIIYAQLHRFPVLLVAAVVPDLPHHNPEGSFSVADVVGDRGGIVAGFWIYFVIIGGVDI